MTREFSCSAVASLLDLAVMSRGGVGPLAQVIAQRFGESASAWDRMLHRILHGRVTYVTSITADRLAVGLGRHPSEIWTDW